MRKQGRVAKGKGKAGGADEWALEEVAAWAVDSLVRHLRDVRNIADHAGPIKGYSHTANHFYSLLSSSPRHFLPPRPPTTRRRR